MPQPHGGLVHERAYKGETNIWLTPKYIIDALGPFDLDPCAAPDPRPWPTADKHITLPEDGLTAKWGNGFVFCNPPYGPDTGKWLKKMNSHGHGIALAFARTETATFFNHVWGEADAIFFIKRRLQFFFPDGTPKGVNAGAPSVLIAYGDVATTILERQTQIEGHLVHLEKTLGDMV